jgi:D-sedoheptulose 7-phosphate isomerase
MSPEYSEKQNMTMVEIYKKELLDRYPVLRDRSDRLEMAAKVIIDAYKNRKKLLVCGNGGSASDADHIVGELMKSFMLPRPLSPELKERLSETGGEFGLHLAKTLQIGFPAIALTQHTALTTAYSNDEDPSLAFAQQLVGYACEGDVFLGITTSGNSRNILAAAVTAKALGLSVLGLTGEGGGKFAQYCDICIDVPERTVYKVQELHLPIYHYLCLAVEKTLAPAMLTHVQQDEVQ